MHLRNAIGHGAEVGGDVFAELVKRVHIPINSSTTPDQIREVMQDRWAASGKYALGWVYFSIILLFFATSLRLFHYWGDKIRTALYKEEIINSAIEPPPSYDEYELSTAKTDGSMGQFYQPDDLPTSKSYSSTRYFFPPETPLPTSLPRQEAYISSIKPINNLIAVFRFVFYRPIPALKAWKWKISFPSVGIVVLVLAGFTFSLLYCFLPKPLFFSTLTYGSPPVAIRAGMLSVSLLPWVVALASKVNPVSFITGIGPERLVVLHRWSAYICIMLALVHAVPFWWQSVHDPTGFAYFKQYFNHSYYVYSSGIAALVPLLLIFFHSLPAIQHMAHELFVATHIPLSWIFLGLMFWHCNNFLTSWAYLYFTLALLLFSLIGRLFHLNWTNPTKLSFMIGEESAVTILTENAIKVTIPTTRRWRPGQYAYIRMPGIALLDNHPFTIASLCSEDFPSAYGADYRDMTLVFRPFGGFTRRVLDTAIKKGSQKTYRALIEGPYGGMKRQMSSFDQVIFFAGGSGITAIVSQLLDLIKRMRDGKATTTTVHVIWAMKRPEIMAWFREELRICRESAPPDSVHCNFYITSATRYQAFPTGNPDASTDRLSGLIGSKIDEVLQDRAAKRNSKLMAEFDVKVDNNDDLTALPQTHLAPPKFTDTPIPYFPPPPQRDAGDIQGKGKGKVKSPSIPHAKDVSTLSLVYREIDDQANGQLQPPQPVEQRTRRSSRRSGSIQTFDYGVGFNEEPTEFRKSLIRFAFLPTTTVQPNMAHMAHMSPSTTTKLEIKLDTGSGVYKHGMSGYSSPSFPSPANPYRPRDGWRTEYGRPDIPFTLRALSRDFGKRTCVFVCGPPEMRVDVARTVAQLQRTIWHHLDRDELFLHTENYAI